VTGDEMAAVMAALDQLLPAEGEPEPRTPGPASRWRRAGRAFAAYDAPAIDGFGRSPRLRGSE
jgi:hypothetical protein